MTLPEEITNHRNKNKKFRKVFENSAHGIDMLLYLFGKLDIQNISKIKLNSFDSGRIVTFINKNKHTCLLIINSNSPSNFSLELENGEKRLLLKPFEKYELYQGMKINAPTTQYPIKKYSPNLIESKSIFDYENTNKNLKPGFYEQTFEFLNLIKNKRDGIGANLKDAYHVQKILEKIM